MRLLCNMGEPILFFCGGETFLWKDNGKTLRVLAIEAKQMGFLIVNVVTNGTFPIDLPEADLILVWTVTGSGIMPCGETLTIHHGEYPLCNSLQHLLVYGD